MTSHSSTSCLAMHQTALSVVVEMGTQKIFDVYKPRPRRCHKRITALLNQWTWQTVWRSLFVCTHSDFATRVQEVGSVLRHPCSSAAQVSLIDNARGKSTTRNDCYFEIK